MTQTAGWVESTIPEKIEASAVLDAISGLSKHERDRFRVTRAIRHMAQDKNVDASLELEVSNVIAKVLGTLPRGLYVPTRFPIRAGLDTKTGTAGGYTVQTELPDLIDLLRNRLLVLKLGATMLTGLKDNLGFPVKTSGSSGSWVSQNPGSDVPDSDATFGQKLMSPKTYQTTTGFSKQLLAQSSIDAENMVRKDLMADDARAIDLAAINGLGTSNQPLGILRTTGIGSVAIGTDGGAPTYNTVVDLETAVANANADVEGMKFLTTPTMRGKLRKTQQFASTNGVPVWQQLGESLGVGDVIGYPGYVSNQVPAALTKGANSDCHAIIFGNWPELLIGEWGVIELIVDPYRLKKQGIVEVTSFHMIDILARQPASFSVCLDARNV